METVEFNVQCGNCGLATIHIHTDSVKTTRRYTTRLADRLIESGLATQVRVNIHYFEGKAPGTELACVSFGWENGREHLLSRLKDLFPEVKYD